jgi:hypothetical protein
VKSTTQKHARNDRRKKDKKRERKKREWERKKLKKREVMKVTKETNSAKEQARNEKKTITAGIKNE